MDESKQIDEDFANAKTLAPTPSVGCEPAPLPSFGDYELLEEIARGGMGIVYKARQRSLDRMVALKMILVGQFAGESEIQRFHNEAKVAAGLRHPHIVAIHEVGTHEGHHFFSMDFIEGRNLAQVIRDQPMPLWQAAEMLRIVAETVHYAHSQGVLHRDLKPSNILIDRAGRPHVTDFGVAKRMYDNDAALRNATLTGHGTLLGTPSYMSPEQASASGELLTPASDVYSLGAILYEILTSRPPFRAANPVDTILQVLHDEPIAPRLLNPSANWDLETISLKCLNKAPKDRYASAQELAQDLDRFLRHEPITARPPTTPEMVARWMRKHQKSVGLTAASVAASLAFFAALLALWTSYERWNRGTVSLSTDGPTLVA
jgi:eukaryotic-like serine/threonine-protein kinase